MLFNKQHTSKSRNVKNVSQQLFPYNSFFQAATPSSSSDKPDFSPGMSDKTQTPTVAPENATEGGIMLLPTNSAPSEPMQLLTPPATAAKAGNVSTELVI